MVLYFVIWMDLQHKIDLGLFRVLFLHVCWKNFICWTISEDFATYILQQPASTTNKSAPPQIFINSYQIP